MDTTAASRFLQCFVWVFATSGLIGYVTFGWMGIPGAALVSVVVSVLVLWATDKFSGILRLMYSGGGGAWNLHERLAADLSRVKYLKMQGRYEEALEAVNGVLKKDSDYPDALYLKARVLWEGFGESGVARQCLKRVLKVTSKDETLHRWAQSLSSELESMGLDD